MYDILPYLVCGHCGALVVIAASFGSAQANNLNRSSLQFPRGHMNATLDERFTTYIDLRNNHDYFVSYGVRVEVLYDILAIRYKQVPHTNQTIAIN